MFLSHLLIYYDVTKISRRTLDFCVKKLTLVISFRLLILKSNFNIVIFLSILLKIEEQENLPEKFADTQRYII